MTRRLADWEKRWAEAYVWVDWIASNSEGETRRLAQLLKAAMYPTP